MLQFRPTELSGDTELHIKSRKNFITSIPRLLQIFNVNVKNVRGETALMVAAQHNAAGTIEKLITYGADVNATDDLGNTALHSATYHCSARITILLCDFQANVNIQNIHGKTPVHLAAQANMCDILNYLTRHSTTNVNYSLVDNEGYTPFLSAVRKGNVRVVRNFIRSGYACEELDVEGRNALHLACSLESTALLRQFPYSNLHDQRDTMGHTPLSTAVRHGNEAAVDYLLQTGSSTLTRDFNGNTILHIVCLGYNLVLLQRLFSLSIFTDKEPRNDLQETPLHLVCREGKLLAFEALLPLRPSFNARDTQGRTPLILAIQFQHNELATALLQVNSPTAFLVDTNTADVVGNTPVSPRATPVSPNFF